MKTMVILPDVLATQAEKVATERGVSLNHLLVQGLESLVYPVPQSLQNHAPTVLSHELAEQMEIDEYGVVVLKNREGVVITNGLVRKLSAEDEVAA